jgi:nicotinate-nucleotide--dimethylbenzimidazole phosphoribosyltransferase
MNALEAAMTRVVPVDAEAARQAAKRQDFLTKPAGSLGRLESLGAQLASIAGACPPPSPSCPAVAVFAGDHGVLAEGVTPWPAEVTAQMVANFLSGGAAINAIAGEVGAAVTVVDLGVSTPVPPIPAPGEGRPVGHLVPANVRLGTANLALEPAMSTDEAGAAMAKGANLATDLVGGGADCLVTGDMGIGNTTPAAALVAAITGRPPREVTGRGTGIADDMWETKAGVVERALGRAGGALVTGSAGLAAADPIELLAQIGGLEIAGIAGFVIGGAAARVPVVVDGVVTLAGALVATALVPAATGYLVAGHRSTEPGASAALEHLGLDPLLDLGLRLGEGTGGCLAVPLLRAAARILSEMATFGDAGVASLDD